MSELHAQLVGDVFVYRAAEAMRQGRDTGWFFDEIRRAEGARRAAGILAPLRVFVDLRGARMALDASRRVVYKRHREMSAHRVAVLGESGLHEFVTTFLIAATGHREARYFTDEARARAWLAEAPG